MTTNLDTPKGEVPIRIATDKDVASLLDLRLEALSLHPEAFAADLNITAADGTQAWVNCISE